MCTCGANDCDATTGMFCSTLTLPSGDIAGKCSATTSCVKEGGKIINENDCTCGLNECDKIEFCVNTDATVLNINAAASCVCGWNTCTISNGLYCTSMQDECSWKYDPCTNTFGNIVNENACTCVSLYNLVLVLRCYFLIVVFLSLTFLYLSIYLFIALHFFLRV